MTVTLKWHMKNAIRENLAKDIKNAQKMWNSSVGHLDPRFKSLTGLISEEHKVSNKTQK